MERSKLLRSTSPFVYCSELLDMTVAEELLLRRNERRIVKVMSDSKFTDRISSVSYMDEWEEMRLVRT